MTKREQCQRAIRASQALAVALAHPAELPRLQEQTGYRQWRGRRFGTPLAAALVAAAEQRWLRRTR